jgi:hypothetical protein
MAGNLGVGNITIVGMSITIEPVGEKINDAGTAELAGG